MQRYVTIIHLPTPHSLPLSFVVRPNQPPMPLVPLVTWMAVLPNSPVLLLGYSIVFCVSVALIANSFLTYKRLKHIKGPLLAGWSRWWIARGTLRRTLHSDLSDACKRYGRYIQDHHSWEEKERGREREIGADV